MKMARDIAESFLDELCAHPEIVHRGIDHDDAC